MVPFTERMDTLQRRHHGAAFPLAVLYKYVDDSGTYLAALMAYYGFVSLFPLLLLLSTVLGFVLSGDATLQHRVLSSALSQFPVVGSQLSHPKRIGGGIVGLVVGIAGSLYGGLGVAQAIQYTMNTAWRVPRNSRPNPFKLRGRSLVLLAVGGLAVVVTTALSAVGGSNLGSFGAALRVVVLVVSVTANAALFTFVFRFATARAVSTRDVIAGALAAAVVWQALQSFGVLYVGHVVKDASATNGVFAFVLGLIAFFYLTALAVVFCVEANVVRTEKLYPRSLLTPFTDNVTLTEGDRRAYSTQAEAQRMKGFQEVDVTFQPSPRETHGEDDASGAAE